jgi:hypothetical protein
MDAASYAKILGVAKLFMYQNNIKRSGEFDGEGKFSYLA